jgi:hypothetical protein
VRLPEKDLDLVAAACRTLAEHYREQANRFERPNMRDGALQRANHAERVAAFLERQCDSAAIILSRDPPKDER